MRLELKQKRNVILDYIYVYVFMYLTYSTNWYILKHCMVYLI